MLFLIKLILQDFHFKETCPIVLDQSVAYQLVSSLFVHGLQQPRQSGSTFMLSGHDAQRLLIVHNYANPPEILRPTCRANNDPLAARACRYFRRTDGRLN